MSATLRDQWATDLLDLLVTDDSGGALLVALDDDEIIALVHRARAILARDRAARARRKRFQIVKGER
jgi:hypothetical protein